MTRRFLTLTAAALLILTACIPVGQIQVGVVEPTGTPSQEPVILTATLPAGPEATPAPTETQVPTPLPTATAEPTFTSEPPATEVVPSPESGNPPEEILILSPGPGSRLTSPIFVTGDADSTFEQSLVVQVVMDDGTVLAVVPVIIQSELGQRGPFEAEIHFSVQGERQAFLQVFATSARDGGITHLSTVGVTLADSGPVDIRPVTIFDERIRIDSHSPGDTVSSGIVRIEGFALASFEQTLVVEILGEDGSVLAFMPVIVQAPDLGFPGPFTADIPLEVLVAGAGRIVVRDPSPAFNGDMHLASVEISLVP